MWTSRVSRRICIKASGLFIFIVANFQVIQVGGYSSVPLSALLAQRASATSAHSHRHRVPGQWPSASCLLSPGFQPLDPGLGNQAKITTRGLPQSKFASHIKLRLSESDVTEEQTGQAGLETKAAGVVQHGAAEEENPRSYRAMFGDVIPAWLIDRLETLGFTEPTPVQKEAIEVIMNEERDALVQSYTGSGKT
eukprot:CAMPEP_0177698088 /NCGR_PEP_ID=MMETSP0484_2-20121128/4852_1 /TAXON_ID=354590 /ORGANISM="Rhodomonas lens, Strain RHODO" /LENGTH=193 /DNA_ID=CAMNT_0019209153 /DNA_START=25 /DNA_END=602 /DNA_ORIENTATION=-